MANSVNVDEPLNFALLYILFIKIGEKMKLKEEEILSPNKIPFYKKYIEFINDKPKADRKKINNVLSRMRGSFPDSYLNDNTFEIDTTLDRLCNLLYDDDYQNFTWSTFSSAKHTEARNLLESRKDGLFFTPQRLKNDGSINVGIVVSSIDPSENFEEFKTKITSILNTNIIRKFETDKFKIAIVNPDAKITNERQANKYGKEKSLDLVVFGEVLFETEKKYSLNVDYAITNEKLQKRMAIRPSNKFKLKKSNFLDLTNGKLLGNIYQVLTAVVGLKYYFDKNSNHASTIAYLESIPVDERIAEVWFILGVCYHDQGKNEKAKASWIKAHEMGHLKASVNLALQLELNFKKSEDKKEKEEIQSEIKRLLPLDRLEESLPEVQLKAAMIFVTINQEKLAEELYHMVIRFSDQDPFKKEALFFLAMLEGNFKTVREMIGESIPLGLKKAGLYYLYKYPDPTPIPRIKILDDLFDSVSENDEEAEKFKSQIEKYRELERMPVGGLAHGKATGELTIVNKNGESVVGSDELLEANGNYRVKNNGSVHIFEKAENGINVKLLSTKHEKAIFELRENLNSYMVDFRGSSSNDTYLLFETHNIRRTKLKEFPTIRLYLSEIDDFLEITQDADGMFPVSRERLEDFYLEEIPEKLSLKVFHPDTDGHFVDSEVTINLAIPNLGTLRDEIEQLTLFVPYQNANEYYKAIRNYLEEFYGRLDRYDMIDWLCEVGLAYEDARIFKNA